MTTATVDNAIIANTVTTKTPTGAVGLVDCCFTGCGIDVAAGAGVDTADGRAGAGCGAGASVILGADTSITGLLTA